VEGTVEHLHHSTLPTVHDTLHPSKQSISKWMLSTPDGCKDREK